MKSTRLLLLWLLLLSSLLVPSTAAKKVDKVTLSSSKVIHSGDKPSKLPSDPTVELNPDYEGTDHDNEEDLDDIDADSESDVEEGIDDGKSKTNQALRANSNTPRLGQVKKFVQKHRFKITLAMVLIAFRREIGTYLLNQIRPEVYDPDTQTTTRKWKTVKIDATQILKIIVFIDVTRQLQTSGKKKDSLLIAALLLGTKNPILSSILSKAILQENSSYIPPVEQHYTFERLNERYTKDCWALQKAAKATSNHSKLHKPLSLASLQHHQRDESSEKDYNQTLIVIDLTNINTAPGRIDMLRDEVSFLIHQHHQKTIPYSDDDDDDRATNREIEVLVLLESPGGSASDFALAAQQLLRLRAEPGITVTVCVDKVAASGGYMIACASSPGKLMAAPFAVIGSIGVYGQTINVQKALEGWGVRPIVVKAGTEKAPIGLLGEVKPAGIKSIQTMVDETHVAFKRHVVTARPRLQNNIDNVATGKVWMGYDALALGLIDCLVTSDEYVGQRMKDGARILKLIKHYRKRWGGPPPPRGGLESYQSTILGAIKNQVIRLLSSFLGPLNLSEGVEEQGEVVPLTSSALNFRIVNENPDASYTASLHHL